MSSPSYTFIYWANLLYNMSNSCPGSVRRLATFNGKRWLRETTLTRKLPRSFPFRFREMEDRVFCIFSAKRREKRISPAVEHLHAEDVPIEPQNPAPSRGDFAQREVTDVLIIRRLRASMLSVA